MNVFNRINFSKNLLGASMSLLGCAFFCCSPHPLDFTKHAQITIDPIVSSIDNETISIEAQVQFPIVKRVKFDSISANIYIDDGIHDQLLGALTANQLDFENPELPPKISKSFFTNWQTESDTTEILIEYQVFKGHKSLTSYKFLVGIVLKD